MAEVLLTVEVGLGRCDVAVDGGAPLRLLLPALAVEVGLPAGAPARWWDGARRVDGDPDATLDGLGVPSGSTLTAVPCAAPPAGPATQPDLAPP